MAPLRAKGAEVPDKFARSSVNIYASKMVELLPRQIEDGRSPDEGDVHSLAVKNVPIHCFTSSLEARSRPSGGWLHSTASQSSMR